MSKSIIKQNALEWANKIECPATGIFILNEAQGIAYDAFKRGAEFAQRWIPVEEELPENNEDVLVKTKYRGIKMTMRSYNEWVYYGKGITHWRPIELK